MTVQEKYKEVIIAAQQNGIKDLKTREENGILYVSGTAPSEDAKNKVWDVYKKLNPNFQSADMVLNLDAGEEYVVQKGDSLSKIGQQFGLPWQDIYEANKDQIKNPDLIQPGWKLKIPKK